MSIYKSIVGICSFLGLTSMAVFAAAQSDATAKAGCVQCFMTFYPGGGTSYGCQHEQDPNSSTGPQYCLIQSGPDSFSCSAEGYGSCSG